jgi:hypothetical protein
LRTRAIVAALSGKRSPTSAAHSERVSSVDQIVIKRFSRARISSRPPLDRPRNFRRRAKRLESRERGQRVNDVADSAELTMRMRIRF